MEHATIPICLMCAAGLKCIAIKAGISSLGRHPCAVCSKGPGKEKVPALLIKHPP